VKIPFNYYYYIVNKYTIQEVFDKMSADYTADGFIAVAPNFAPVSIRGNQLPGDRAVNQPYTVSPDFRGGYRGEQTGSTGGGYDPNNPSYADGANSIGGVVAVNPNYSIGADFRGGYNGEQTAASGGGYDPTTGVNQSDSANSIGGAAAISQNYNIGADFRGGYNGEQVEESGGGAEPDVGAGELSDPTNARPGSDLLEGYAGGPAVDPSVIFQSETDSAGTASVSEVDWRVRVSLADNAKVFYKDPNGKSAVLAPLIETNGVIFPYTPSISVTHSAQYVTSSPTHSNYIQQFYNNSQVEDITITGEFSVQSIEEGQYLMAAIYFFRSATKMFFGNGTNLGNPPPIVFLDGYGSHYFPHVPCVVSAFTHVLANDVDYIQIPVTSTYLLDVPVQQDPANIGTVQLTAQEQQYAPALLSSPRKSTTTKSQFQTITSNSRVPTSSQISITLKPVYSRKSLHERFDLNKFAAGQLLRDSKNGYGGFL
jgi:hypothetical protein